MTEFQWDRLRRYTQSRIGLGRAGDSLPTARVLEFRAAHAAARDAVHAPLELETFAAQVKALGLGDPVHVTSRAGDRASYLRRPDLGRLPDDLSRVGPVDADIAFVLADGLCAPALARHGAPMLAAAAAAVSPLRVAPPVIATLARVALGDHVAAALGVRTMVVLIGERPGLSVADSLGCYLTHRLGTAKPTDADRNCISNIHPPEGLGYADAARVLAGLVTGARQLGHSGVTLKDTSRPALTQPHPHDKDP